MERGFHKAGDVEIDWDIVGQLGTITENSKEDL
jgi:hypothetical protein